MYLQKVIIIIFLITGFTNRSNGQNSSGFFGVSDTLNTPRRNWNYGVIGAGYIGTMVGLNELWYSQHPRSNFHFFNDNDEWLQIDKIGHACSAYYLGYLGMKSMQWAGLTHKKAIWTGGLVGYTFLTTVEILDGFSSGWGASWGDVAANTLGFGLFATQEYLWKEQRVWLKFSYSGSPFAKYRPETLGSSATEKLLKDYNGQSYWLSVNVAAFLSRQTKFPKWLNVALGYSGDGMLGGTNNPAFNSKGQILPKFERKRQFILSLDLDLNRIRTKSALVNTLLGTFGFIKVPFPALMVNDKGEVSTYLFYF